jgi:hypothetical protein
LKAENSCSCGQEFGGTISSSRRFKDEIKPMDKSSEVILALKPVTFHYKSDKQNTPQFGLIAEEVAKIRLRVGTPSTAERLRGEVRSAAETNRSPHRDYPESDRPSHPQQTCAALSRQPVNIFVTCRI